MLLLNNSCLNINVKVLNNKRCIQRRLLFLSLSLKFIKSHFKIMSLFYFISLFYFLFFFCKKMFVSRFFMFSFAK